MTRVHLLRHAHAGDPVAWDGPDAARPLNEKGRAQAKRLGRFLAERRFQTDRILTSPKVRAVQTAELVAGHLDQRIVIDERLGGSLDLATLEAILQDHHGPERPVLVGHDPDFSELVSLLTGCDIPMRKGAMARIDAERPFGVDTGTLRWLLPPDLLKPDG